MLSEFCVRRPVSATMLVMSLVVLGLFSFRDLGVDLFPKADPATVSVQLIAARRQPGRDVDVGRRADGRGDQRHLGHRRDAGAHRPKARPGSPSASCSSATSTMPSNDVREKVAGAIQSCAAGAAAAGHHEGRSRRRPGVVADRVVEGDEPADADRAGRQADQRAPSRPSTASARSSLGGGRAREIHIVVDIEKLNSYGLSIGQVRDAVVAENVEIPGGTVEQGKGQLLLRTLGRVDAAEDFNYDRRSPPGTARLFACPISATRKTASERPTSAVWLGRSRLRCMLDVRRAMGENTVAVIEGVRAKLAGHRAVAAVRRSR